MNTLTLIIRQATIDDVKHISELISQTWKKSYKGILPDKVLQQQNAEKRRQTLIEEIKADNKVVFVAEQNGKIVGMVSGGPIRQVIEEYDGELYAMYVSPEYQNQGIGKKLFVTFKDWVYAHGFKSFVLWTLKDNKPTRLFYESQGGSLLKETNLMNIPDHPCITFELVCYVF